MSCTHPRSYYHCASNICPDCGHRWGGPNESRLRAEGRYIATMRERIKHHTGEPVIALLCGPTFLLAIARRTGTTETESEILARFKDCLGPDGFYIMKAQP